MSTVRSVYTNLRSLQSVLKDAGRLRQIAFVLIRHGFGAAVSRLGLSEVLSSEERKALPPVEDDGEALDALPLLDPAASIAAANSKDLAYRLRLVVEELGPTFIKLGQILSTRGDLMPPAILEELQRLQDDVPPMAREEVAAQILEELGADPETLFAAFSWEPLACASIAQVHVATLRHDAMPPAGADVAPHADTSQETDQETESADAGGERVPPPEVVVKVQRPNITATVEADLHILHFLARRARAMLPELEMMDPVGIVREFERAIRKEMDFTHEVQHLQRFARHFADFEGVRIPAVWPALCTSRVLVMERIDGVKITRAPEVYGIDPYEVAPRMLRALFKMVFQDGYFHGDLHPGNILIDEHGTIGLIDFGLVGRLSPHQRDQILDVLIGISQEDYVKVARIYFELGIKQPGIAYDYDLFESDVIEVMENHISGRTLSDIDVGAFFGELVQGCLRHGIRMPSTFTMVFKALVTVEGIGRTLAPRVNFIEEAQPFVRDIVAARYSPKRLIEEGAHTLDALSRFLRVAPWSSAQVLKDLAQGRLVLSTELHNLPVLAAATRRAAILQGRAILGGAALIAAVLAMPLGTPILLGLNMITLGLLGLAALASAPLLRRM